MVYNLEKDVGHFTKFVAFWFNFLANKWGGLTPLDQGFKVDPDLSITNCHLQVTSVFYHIIHTISSTFFLPCKLTSQVPTKGESLFDRLNEKKNKKSL
jgi:hypothetical protein